MKLIIRRLRSFVAIFFVFALTGCASSYMSPTDRALNPSPENATVTFFRTALFGSAIQAPVAKETVEKNVEPVGIISKGFKVTQEVAPGEITYVVGGEGSCVLSGTVEANKHYYVRVEPHMGLWKARFTLDPVSRSSLLEEDSATRKDISECTSMELNKSGIEWFEQNNNSMKAKLVNPSNTKPLNPEDGVDELS